MTVFFAVAGMEIKRELVQGELRTLRRAALPLIAAAGGMLVPALVYLAINGSAPARSGWAIPTATDIAFALGCLSLVRRRIPWSLFVFLTALAIFDDLGAILIIAFAYGSPTTLAGLVAPLALVAVLVALSRYHVQQPWVYAAVGILLWLAFSRAGLHPTLAGVIVGLAIPTTARRTASDTLRDLDVAIERLRQLPPAKAEGALTAIATHVRSMQPPVERLLHDLHAPVAFAIVPVFAFANAGIVLGGNDVTASVASGVAAALVAGKGIGVFGSVWLAVRLGIAPMPTNARWPQVAGVALLAGIGFTMSLFVTQLAFPHDAAMAMSAKIGILGGSLVSSLAGLAVLRVTGHVAPEEPDLSVLHLDLPRFAEGYRVESWETSPEHAGKTLTEAALRRDHGITVLGVFREHDDQTDDGVRIRKLESVGPDYVLREGETMLVVGENERMTTFLERNQREVR